MPTFYDSHGNSYVLNQQIGRGGEGTVFFCPNDLALVAKIYHEPIDDEKAEKLRWMAENKNEQLLKVAAWIVDTLHETPNGRIVGFLMPNVKAKEIHELYSLKSRRVHFPEATWQFLIHAAANVARAFYNLHRHDHIMGDVNHGNCVVLADGTVKLIDCDSYSIKTDELRYACEVGVATHLAPELQGLDLGEVEREKKHDNFGVAVIIFQLLFLGRHPFAGNYLGEEDKSLEDCIRERRFAYGNNTEITQVKQPPGTLALEAVSPRIAAMFERAFFTEDRPEPREWIEALEDLSNSLKQCSVHIGHHYFNALTACPWCEIESKTGLMLFPFVSGKGGGEQNFNIFTIENLLAGLEIPQNLPTKPVKASVLPPPSAKAREIQKTNQKRLIHVGLIQFFIVLLLTVMVGAGVGFFIGAILMVGFLVTFYTSDRAGKEQLESDLYGAQLEWKQIEKDWDKIHNPAHLTDDLTTIRDRIAEHQAIQRESRERIQKVKDEIYQYKLNRYLMNFRVEDAGISEFADFQDFFKQKGIWTAADVEDWRLKVLPEIKAKTCEELRKWRENLERNFEFKDDAELPEAQKTMFEVEFAERRRRVEREIEQILVSLRSGSLMVRQQQKIMAFKAETVIKKLLQSESDLATMGNSTLMIVVLIFITALVPMFGAAFQTSAPIPRVKPVAQTYSSTSGSGGSPDFKKVEIKKQDDFNFYVNERITDQEIEEMSATDRNLSAKSLYKQATELMLEEKYKEAEKKLRLAVKFVNYDDKIQIALAETLYELKKYAESLKIFENWDAYRLDKQDILLLKGKNYIGLGKNDDAIRELSSALQKDKKSFDVNFYLGTAYKNKKLYNAAVTYFSNALNVEPNHTIANYELGICYFKNGDKDTAQSVYESLFDLDEEKAEQLRRLAGLKKVEPTSYEEKTVRGRGVGQGAGEGFGVGN